MVETLRSRRVDMSHPMGAYMGKRLKSILDGKLPRNELEHLDRSYDIIGDIAIIRIPDTFKALSLEVAETIMRIHKQVKAVLRQASGVSGEFRLRELQWIAGEKKTETEHKEFGCVFKVDVESCYFSPRLSFERMRVARLVKPSEIVVNMFAGVGTFSVLIARFGKAMRVYSIDLNPSAFSFANVNIRLNRVEDRVVPVLGDAKEVVFEHLGQICDRVVMPLPEKAYEYLDCAVFALKPSGGWIHYYDFEHASRNEDPLEKVKARVAEKMREMGVGFEVPFGRVVRSTGPNWYQVVLDVQTST